MAAMAQQDCGQCGYNCKDYADALFAKSEKRLNLCVPGGKETSRMLKSLIRSWTAFRRRSCGGARARHRRAGSPAKCPFATAPGRSRDNPVYAAILSRRRLNKPGSKKRPGISTSILPAQTWIMSSANHSAFSPPTITISLPRCLRRSTCRRISDRRPHLPRSADRRRFAIAGADMLFELISYLTGGERRQKAKRLAAGEDPDGDAVALDVLAALHKFPGISWTEAFIERSRAAAARLFDFLVAPLQSRPRLAHRRCGASRDRHADAARRLLEFPARVVPGDKIRVYV